MAHILNGSARRILSYPAVHPCEAISPSTLLDSTISLALQITALRPDDIFISHKKNARNTIRLIQVLLIFLQELRESVTDLGSSIKLPFSELHVVLQKLRFLLEDCLRRDARLWMLMNSPVVANHIRVLMRDLAASMEVMPLGSMIGLSDLAEEWFDFVMRQARRLRFEVDPVDEWGSNLVSSILGRFKEKVIPDPSDVRRVLEYLDIRRWSECDGEIRFLDELVRSGNSSSSKAAMASDLRGLMIYSRCVLFDSVDSAIDQAVDCEGSGWLLNRLKSVDFRCPISLEIMADPVTISTGHTYDRASILKWFKEGNPICPKTGERLVSLNLVPNLALQRLIGQYCVENGIAVPKSRPPERENIQRTASAGGKGAEGALKMAADFLVIKLAIGAIHERSKAAYEIRLLTKNSIFHRACIVESGAIPLLLNLTLSYDPVAQENAAAALLNLSKHPQAKSVIVECGGLPLILDVLQNGLKMEARHHSAAVLFYLCSVVEYRGLIGSTRGMIPTLVELIRSGNDRGKKHALVAVFGLILDPSNHHRVLSTGLVPLVVSLLEPVEKEELVINSLAVLSALGERLGGAIAILGTKSLGSIVGILRSSISMPGKEHCASLLHALCTIGGREVVKVLVKDHSLMESLYSLLREGTSRARKNASALIRIFHEFSRG